MTLSSDGTVTLQDYEATAAALIKSWVDRFPDTEVDVILEELWQKDQEHFGCV